MSIFSSYLNTLTKRYATLSGRANRQEYCAFMIVFSTYVLIWQVFHSFLMFGLISKHIYKAFFLLMSFIELINIIPFSFLISRRLQDLGIRSVHDTEFLWEVEYQKYDKNAWRFIMGCLVFMLICAGIGFAIYVGTGIYYISTHIYSGIMPCVFLGAIEGQPRGNVYGKIPAKKDDFANRFWVLAIMVNIICFVALFHLLREMHDGTA